MRRTLPVPGECDMSRSKPSRHVSGLSTWIGAALLSLVSTQAPGEQGSPFPFFQPTIEMEDVAPGVDHGNSNNNLPADFQRQVVFYRSQHPAGTIIIETAERHLYLIESDTRALRYGIGVGRDGFTWAGLLKITRKVEWPDWRPPSEMIERQPYLPRFMAGDRVIRLAHAPCIWATPSTESMEPTRRRPSATPFPPAAFAL